MYRIMSRILGCFCAAMIVSSAARAAEECLSLFDFETPEQVQSFKVLEDNKNSFTFVTEPEHVGSGKGAACFYVPPSGTGEHYWPRASGAIPEGKRDWIIYDELKMTIINPE